jgi:hypothetical protein
MQRKCHRCDRLYTTTDHNTWCSDCMEGKPVVRMKKSNRNNCYKQGEPKKEN